MAKQHYFHWQWTKTYLSVLITHANILTWLQLSCIFHWGTASLSCEVMMFHSEASSLSYRSNIHLEGHSLPLYSMIYCWILNYCFQREVWKTSSVHTLDDIYSIMKKRIIYTRYFRYNYCWTKINQTNTWCQWKGSGKRVSPSLCKLKWALMGTARCLSFSVSVSLGSLNE